jgi:uncharacterized 2Fe-2S/4Fe-4S cluster protein (DUF4445 family)
MDALKGKNIILRSDCGGKGKCGKCRVEKFSDDTAQQNREDILACTFQVDEDLKIEIPESALFSTHTLGKAAISLPSSFKDQFRDGKEKSEETYGIAADLGTTTIAVYLCDMNKGEVIGSASIKNPQALYGDDVMSRISTIGQAPETLLHLQSLVTGAMEKGIHDLVKASDYKKIQISRIVVVGNPAMIHILAGVDPAPIGVSPYQPAFFTPKKFKGKDLGFTMEDLAIHTLPQVSGFIGGDILAAGLAVDLENQPEGTLLIDLGTNGELMLRGRDRLFATSCATGPAFEGATLACGMQAIPGAVNRVVIDSTTDLPGFECIQGKKNSFQGPTGICGSGVVSAVAQFCKQGIILPDGKFDPALETHALAQDDSGKYHYTIVPKNSEQKGSHIFISQKDIRSVQLGKGALITGIHFLLKKAGFDRPEKLIIAGAFGAHLDKEDMKTLGMIPNLESDLIEMAGNAAGTGAVMALCIDDYLVKAKEMAQRIEVVDLASDQAFHASFINHLGFPKA